MSADLNEHSLQEFMVGLYSDTRNYVHWERARLWGGKSEATLDDVARPPSRWKHDGSFQQDSRWFEVWINWDGRVRIECDGVIVLSMWYPAGEIISRVNDRCKAHHA
jgi:hypothetical protein